MFEWLNISLRFALYVDLSLLLGLPLFLLYNHDYYGKSIRWGAKLGPLLVILASVGVLLSIGSMVLLAKTMSGADHVMEIEQHIIGLIITDTDAGLACLVRMSTLLLTIVCAACMNRWPAMSIRLSAIFAAIALATLAWSGHGAMDEGARRYVHFAADILHMIAAAGWIGALGAFVLLLRRAKREPGDQMRLLRHGLARFASVGTLIVITLAITGAVNYWLIVGPTLARLVSSLYGVLLLIKLSLFAVMLILAAANRLHLTPLLERAVASGDHEKATAYLHRTLTLETGAATLILLLVAWLGTLSPTG